MKTQGRLDKTSLKVLTGQDTTTASRPLVGVKRIADIVQAAERLADGCIVYRLEPR